MKDISIHFYTLLYVVSAIVTYLHINYINHHTEIQNYNNLPDMIVDNLPDLSQNKLCQSLTNNCLILWLSPILLSKNTELCYLAFKIFSIIYFLRNITKLFTIIPSQQQECKSSTNDIRCYIFGYCHDKIFSGHLSLSLVLLLVTIDNKLIGDKYIPLAMILHVIYAGLILAVRNHYSVDIILAYIICISVFYNIKDIV